MRIIVICAIELIVAFFSFSNGLHSGQEISGCGGFIKSYTDIDYSKVEVQLYTKQGSLKDKTDCSPSNGYYFLPLYNKGEYILKISPPAGWSFEPKEILVTFDGKNDECSLGKDLNFAFKGFGITGVISIENSKKYAPNVVLKLMSQTNETLRTTTSDTNGAFSFTPVFPGTYLIEASHPKWTFVLAKQKIIVKPGNTELPVYTFIVAGFSVDGHVLSNHPITQIGMALYSYNIHSSPLCHQMNEPPVTLPKTLNDKVTKLWCYTDVSSTGGFIFDVVPSGKYILKPHIKNKDIQLHIVPDAIDVNVLSDSLTISSSFEVTGFSVTGKVLTKPNGRGIENAEIHQKSNGKLLAITQADGSFIIENIKAGDYIFQIRANDLQFNDYKFQISLANLYLPDIVVNAFKICGQIVSKKSYIISIVKYDSDFNTKITTNAVDGSWCTFLQQGKYTVKVLITEEERSNGIQFFPLEQQIEVLSAPISDIIFSKLRAFVSGEVQLMANEQSNSQITINLRSLNINNNQNSFYATTNVANGKYNFTGVSPGTYEVSISDSLLCWETTMLTINVQSKNEIIPPIIHIGYMLSIDISHTAQMQYKLKAEEQPLAIKIITIVPGINKFCVPNRGEYELLFFGCHIFNVPNNSIVLRTGDKTRIIKAIKHRADIQIWSQIVRPFQLLIESDGQTENVKMITNSVKKNNQYFVYHHEFHLVPKQHLSITPKNDAMLFKPATTIIEGMHDCMNEPFIFIAYEGITIIGKILPPIDAVEITCEFTENSTLPVLKTISNRQGEFKFGPVDTESAYRITATKNSYVFSEFDTTTNTFTANKLCEIVASVKDDKGQSLSGVLLSLSGAESYRKNVITTGDGIIKFHSLSPSQYFLRPMMKEYKFEPNSKIINVKDGETAHIELIGKRVAFSLHGFINSLNGEPFANIIVESIAKEPCAPHQEEATTDQNGAYRILGLQANCEYTVRIKPGLSTAVERTIPTEQTVFVKEEELNDINGFAIGPMNFVDIIVRIVTVDNNHYKSLKVKLYKKDVSSRPVYTQKISQPFNLKSHKNYGVMVFFPRIPLDGTEYFVEVSSSIFSATNFNNAIPVKSFVANESSIFVEIDFKPQTRPVEGEINQNSLYALIIILIVGLVSLKQNLVIELATLLGNKLIDTIRNAKANSKTAAKNEFVFDDNEIEKLAQNINATKKKSVRKQ